MASSASWDWEPSERRRFIMQGGSETLQDVVETDEDSPYLRLSEIGEGGISGILSRLQCIRF